MPADKPATLKQSNGSSVVSAVLNPKTIRALVRSGHATPVDTTYTNATLKTAAHDTLYTNATAQNPISLGLDDIRQVPAFYPEKT